MEGRQANYPFNVYAFKDNDQTDHLGGANDLASATTLAGAHYVAKQSYSPTTNWGVGVLQDDPEAGVADALVAYVGWHEGD